MASELRVNQITSITGVGTVTFDAGGVTFAGRPNLGNAAITSINSGPISGTRNRIINGDCRIDQRYSGGLISTIPANVTYVLDRWGLYSGLGGIFRAQRNLNSVTPPPGFSNYLGIQNISTSSSNINTLQQSIEGFNFSDFDFGTPNARTITLSFWMYSSLTGLFGGTFMNYAQTRIYPFSWTYNSPNTWQYVTIQIPGDTSGTWVGSSNAGAASLVFCLGGGSSFFSAAPGSWISSVGGGTYGVSGQVSLASVLNATFYVTGVQLELGTVATPFERRSYGQELALCQRYFEQIDYNQRFAGYSSYLTAFSILNFQFKQTKRSTSYTVYVSSSSGATFSARTNTFVFFSPTPGGDNTAAPASTNKYLNSLTMTGAPSNGTTGGVGTVWIEDDI